MRPKDSRVSSRTYSHVAGQWRFCVTVNGVSVIDLCAVSYTAANAARHGVVRAVRRALGERVKDGRAKP